MPLSTSPLKAPISKGGIPLEISFHPKQMEAFQTPATELLFGGATRGGKSFFTRMALIIWCSWIPGLQCFIFRKYYDDVLQNHMESPDGFRAILSEYQARGIVRITENQIRWVHTGSLITLGHCSTDDAVEKNQGVPKHVLVLEEVCQILERHIRFLRAWVSMPIEMQKTLPAQFQIPRTYWRDPIKPEYSFPRVIETGNPIGVSMGYFRRNFVKAAPPNALFRAPLEEGGFLRQYIEAKVEDNPSEDRQLVIARVAGLGDPSMTDALINANWDAPVGDFFPQYDDKKHSTTDFTPPAHWFKFLTFDWGMSDPFAVLWWAVSDGEEFHDPKAGKKWFPRGSLVAYREWYGCDRKDSSKGIEMRNPEIANGIRDSTEEATSGIILTDSKPFQDVGLGEKSDKYKISDIFAENGVPLIKANTARVTGWAQVRDRLIGKDGWPLIYFCHCCRYTREYLPALERKQDNREDAVDEGEATHLCDCVRYACTSRPLTKDIKKEASTAPDFNVKITPSAILKQLKRQSRPSSSQRRRHAYQ